ncbi:MAG: methylated-DNA--[protein]-cysteine S-methyltransferase [Planctomycetota bacterium]
MTGVATGHADTPLGTVRVHATERGVCQVELRPGRAASAGECEPSRAARKQLAKALRAVEAYFAGRVDALGAIPLDLPPSTDFRERIYQLLRGVPAGEVVSYGDLAELAGRPRAARAVGSAMRNNPVPLFVPCHRVIAAGGKLGGFNGGLEIKVTLLDHERVSRRESPAPTESLRRA